jgi:hypothetical protein
MLPSFLLAWARNRCSGPALGLGPEPVLLCPASPCTQECAAATLGQGPLRACALTSTGGLAVPRLADQRSADFARCAHQGIGLAGALGLFSSCMHARARANAAKEVGERGRERYEYARARGAMRAREVLHSAAPSLPPSREFRVCNFSCSHYLSGTHRPEVAGSCGQPSCAALQVLPFRWCLSTKRGLIVVFIYHFSSSSSPLQIIFNHHRQHHHHHISF